MRSVAAVPAEPELVEKQIADQAPVHGPREVGLAIRRLR
jgi:hypothetical protein